MKTKKITAITLALITAVCLFGCRAYVEQKTDLESMVGTWNLNCVYADTKAIEFDEEVLVVGADATAQRSVSVVSKEETTAADGTVVPAEKKVTVTKYTVKLTQKGSVNFSSSGETTDYEFSVDVPAGDMHMYAEKEGVYYHYIYRLVEEDK